MTDDDLKKIRGLIKEELQLELDPIKQTLAEHSGKLDALTGDMMNVQKTTKATYELLLHEVEQRREEVDEIRNHVDMPKLERTRLKQPTL